MATYSCMLFLMCSGLYFATGVTGFELNLDPSPSADRREVQIPVGTQLSIRCFITGVFRNDRFDVSWSYPNGRRITADSTERIHVQDDTQSARLIIQNFQSSDMGRWTCQVSEEGGSRTGDMSFVAIAEGFTPSSSISPGSTSHSTNAGSTSSMPSSSSSSESARSTPQSLDSTTQSLGSTTQSPGTTTQAPRSTTEASRSTTQASRNTTQAPRITTQSPHSTTQSPESTTQSHRSTTQSPDSTTQSPRSTSRKTPSSSASTARTRLPSSSMPTSSTTRPDMFTVKASASHPEWNGSRSLPFILVLMATVSSFM